MQSTAKFGTRYPWDDWFDRGIVTLVRGRHYLCRTDSMVQMVRFAAADRNLLVNTTIADDGSSISFAVVGEGKRRPGRPRHKRSI